ncbi:hypothetical protein TNCV_913961 [Trichonephila clavipes]|nr:hypothetical protein TNCV_913961 [Trichonephila clavipes]
MIESTTNSNEFRSKDGTVVRIPDADFNIVPRNVTKNTTPCSTRIRTTTICVNRWTNQVELKGVIRDKLLPSGRRRRIPAPPLLRDLSEEPSVQVIAKLS